MSGLGSVENDVTVFGAGRASGGSSVGGVVGSLNFLKSLRMELLGDFVGDVRYRLRRVALG